MQTGCAAAPQTAMNCIMFPPTVHGQMSHPTRSHASTNKTSFLTSRISRGTPEDAQYMHPQTPRAITTRMDALADDSFIVSPLISHSPAKRSRPMQKPNCCLNTCLSRISSICHGLELERRRHSVGELRLCSRCRACATTEAQGWGESACNQGIKTEKAIYS